MSDTKKTLLNEATIRRFMKLGGLKPLTETFFDKNETIEEEVEETIEEEVEELEEMSLEDPTDDEPEMGEPEMGEPEMGEPEMGEPELDEPAEEAMVSDEQAEEILAAVASALGVDATIASADDAEPMDDMDDLPAEEPMMETTDEETVTEETDTDEETVTEETDTDEETVTEETDTDEVDESLVAEISRRVAARLDGASKRENLAEKLAERIFNKLSKKG